MRGKRQNGERENDHSICSAPSHFPFAPFSSLHKPEETRVVDEKQDPMEPEKSPIWPQKLRITGASPPAA
jgi:hypothetical protein